MPHENAFALHRFSFPGRHNFSPELHVRHIPKKCEIYGHGGASARSHGVVMEALGQLSEAANPSPVLSGARVGIALAKIGAVTTLSTVDFFRADPTTQE